MIILKRNDTVLPSILLILREYFLKINTRDWWDEFFFSAFLEDNIHIWPGEY